jgi:hypothetical protein
MLGVLVTAPRAKLHDLLDTNAKGLHLLSDDVLVHSAAQMLYKTAAATVFWE